jgi:hypothetical protein
MMVAGRRGTRKGGSEIVDNRSFRDRDLDAMQDLTRWLWSPVSRWHVGELAWMRKQHLAREAEWRTRLWEREGQAVAWAWVQLPGELDVHVTRLIRR